MNLEKYMRLAYKREELVLLYERLVRKAEKRFYKGNYSKSIKCIESAASFQYLLNDRFTDNRLNLLLKGISLKLYPQNVSISNKNIVFFYESFCLDNRGLTQQYLDALVSCNQYKIVLILECPISDRGQEILQYCNSNDIEIKPIIGNSWHEKADYLFNLINEYEPKAALFHLTPSSFLPFIAFEPYKSIKKYQINLTDHAFWLGSSEFFDYSYEFRDYGAIVSLEKRGFLQNQIIINPYYPWQSNMEFQGFPVSTDGKIVVFSGGHPYKIEGDNGKYYEMVAHILEHNSDVLFFYAGDGDLSFLQKFITDNHYEERMFLLGNRKDIDAVFKRCDMYLNTHPLGGGLMVQYAAINGKPILIYNSPSFDDLVCTKKKAHISYDTIEDFYKEADKLIDDFNYRKQRGEYYKSLIAGQSDFRKRFISTFMNDNKRISCPRQLNIDYDSFCLEYLYKINHNVFEFVENYFIKHYIFSCKVLYNFVLYFPEYIKARYKGK